MAIQREDVQHLVDAHSSVKQAIEDGRLLQAAKILCSTFGDLLNRADLWADLHAAAQSAQLYHAEAAALLEDMGSLIDEEGRVFEGLGIAPPHAMAILRDVFAGRAILLNNGNAQLADLLSQVQRELEEVRGLVCAESEKGAFRYACAWVMSETGRKVIADIAAVVTNATIVGNVPHLTYGSMFTALIAAKQDAKACREFLTHLAKHR